jgi:hypothetical protein
VQNASLEAYLYLGDSGPGIPLEQSHSAWWQEVDSKGRPRSKVRFGRWSFATSLLDQAAYERVLALMLSDTAVVDARAEYLRADGQGVFVTVWGRRCTVSHVYEHFDSRGTNGRQPGCILYFSLTAEQMGREPGTAGTFVMPPPRSYAAPVALLEREVDDEIGSTAESFPANDAKPANGLATLIANCICIGEPEKFREAVLADLEKIYATPTGKKLLESLAKSGKTVAIEYSMGNNSMLSYDVPAARFFQADGQAGAGTSSKIGYNPTKEYISDDEWGKRPPAIGLAHELIHAEQAAYGRMCTGKADNDGRMDGGEPAKPLKADIRELEAVGIPPQDGYQFSENKIRKEWDPQQPERKWY